MKTLSKKILMITLFFTLLSITISSASAAENNTDLGDLISTSSDNSVIELGEGTYSNNVANITIDKNVTIVGKGTDKTIIDAKKEGQIFYIENNGTLTLINITITNGYSVEGAGAIESQGKLTLTNCIFSNSSGANGGAISNEGNLIVTNCIFINNNALMGGAIYGMISMITNSSFINNTALWSGGSVENYGDNLIVTNCNFINNTADYSGAMYNQGTNSKIINCNFINNKAIGSYGAGGAILNNGDNFIISNSNFTNNSAGTGVIYSSYANFTITGCNIINNTYGIYITDDSENATINYNRIFNNSGYDLNNSGINTNADYNWWGSNNPTMTNIIGVNINNYFMMNVTNLTSLDSNGTVTFLYTFKLNNSDSFDPNLLPYFTTDVYTNLNTGVVESIDARFDKTFDVTVNTSGNILYTFVTDDEVQTLEGTTTITEPPTSNPTPTPTPNPTPGLGNNSTELTEKTNNNPTVSASMKETGIPINLIFLVLLSFLGLGYYKKKY